MKSHRVLYIFFMSSILNVLDSKQAFQLIGKHVNGVFAAKRILNAVGGPLCSAMEIYFGKLNCTPSVCGSRKGIIPYKKRIIVSFGHNGLGNQLWQHHFAKSVSTSIESTLYFAQIPPHYTFQNTLPPNTKLGAWAIRHTLDRRLFLKALSRDHHDRMSCSRNNFSFFDRNVDRRRIQLSHDAQQVFTHQLLHFLSGSSEVQCMVLLGFFQSKVRSVL